MNSKQQLIALIGIGLIGLTIWQHWRAELTAILFNAPSIAGQRQTLSKINPDTGASPHLNEYGQVGPLGPNGGYSMSPNGGLVPDIPNIV